MDEPNRVMVVLEELGGVAHADEAAHLLHTNAEAPEEAYQGKGKGLGKGKSNTLKRGLVDVDQVAGGELMGGGVGLKKRKLDGNSRENQAVAVNSAEVENLKENVIPRLIDKVEEV